VSDNPNQLPDVIDGAESFIRRFCILPSAAYLPLAAWAVATHMPDAFDSFPYIALLSPAKRCGKTRVLEVLELLTSKAWRGTSAVRERTGRSRRSQCWTQKGRNGSTMRWAGT